MRLHLGYLFGLMILFATGARAAPVDPAVLARLAAIANEERELARGVRDSDAAVLADYFKLGAFLKEDSVGLKAASEALAVAHERIAAACDRNDGPEAIDRLRKEMDAAFRVRMLWRERIVEYRVKQYTAAPSEHWFGEFTRWYQAAGMNELMAFAEARKAAAEAWGRVAEACVPDADPAAFEALKEQAYAMDTEREIAEMRFTWARDMERMLLQDKKVTSPELTRRVEALTKLHEERLAAKRASNEQERLARRLERQIQVADAEFRKAYEQAQREALERARNVKPK